MVKLKSSGAFILYLVIMSGGMIFATFVGNVPYTAFASNITIATGAFLGKRHLDRKAGRID